MRVTTKFMVGGVSPAIRAENDKIRTVKKQKGGVFR